MRKILAGLLLITVCAPVQAQTPAATPAPAAAQPPRPQPLPPEKSISLVLALEGVQTALDSCKAVNSLAAVEIVDLNDTIKVMMVADGAGPQLSGLAGRKAYTVIKKNMSSGDFGKQVGPQVRGGPPIEGDANLITFAGALPIRRGADLIGAISVSGPTGAAADEACAQAGLDKIKGRLSQ